jgi:hypothetical protein
LKSSVFTHQRSLAGVASSISAASLCSAAFAYAVAGALRKDHL